MLFKTKARGAFALIRRKGLLQEIVLSGIRRQARAPEVDLPAGQDHGILDYAADAAGGSSKAMESLLHRGIELFNEGEFFECHEVLEEAWTPERGPRRLFLQALIHVAVGSYHCRRSNPRGASGQLRKALRKLAPYLPSYENVDTDRLYRDAHDLLERVEAGETIVNFPRMVTSKSLTTGTD